MIKRNHQAIAANFLFFLNLFILFLLVFGNNIAIPQWLQPVGRMHPLILHFPIVLLILAVLLELLRYNPKFTNEPLYQKFSNLVWLWAAIFASITVIMGLFLSNEAGYEGATLQLHKWLGVGIAFMATAINWIRNKKWYSLKVLRISAGLLLACLIVGGDYGANLTHGDNFLLAPVWHPEKEKVAIDKALVFNDLIEPIFQAKCTSCHNSNKSKGGLVLVDEKSVLKGGKTGKLFVAGQPQLSLLLKRIHEPEQEKKHMPPIGKPQLSSQEMLLLYFWVKENTGFNKKIVDLPANDSLRMLAADFFKPADNQEVHFNFEAADEKLIKKLNNNYRVIYPFAQNSPALGVNIYNKKIYQPKVLEELLVLKKQIISLDLSRMPVKDAELKTIAKFENLQTLILNFTDITGSNLKELAQLKHLNTLALSGVKLDANAVTELAVLKSVNKLTIWDTGLSEKQIEQIKGNNKQLLIIRGFKDDGKAIKLNNPQIANTSFIFADKMPLLLKHPIQGVDIRYTTDGSNPDSIKSTIFKSGTYINKTAVIKAQAFKQGWLGSEEVSFNFYKNTYTPDSIGFIAGPNEKYSGDGAKTLIDKDLGGSNFGNGKWVASQKDLIIFMQFNTPKKINTVTLNCMRNIGSQIFFPVGVEVWGGLDKNHLKLLKSIKMPAPLKDDAFSLNGIDCILSEPKSIGFLKIIAKPIQKLPSWDPVKNQPGWVFIDEIFLN